MRTINRGGQPEPNTAPEILKDIFSNGGNMCREREKIARHAALDNCIISEQATRTGDTDAAKRATRAQERNERTATEYAAAAEKLETLAQEYDILLTQQTDNTETGGENETGNAIN